MAEGDREELHFIYDAVGNRTTGRLGRTETHYRYDAADQLEAAEHDGRRVTYRYDSSGRLTEEIDGERRRIITYDGFGLPATVTRTSPGTRERIQKIFNGDGLLVSLTLAGQHDRSERRSEEHEAEEEQASVRYRWSSDQIPQILTQFASPRLDDAEHDHPGRLAANFAYGYGRTFASWEDGAAAFHMDAFGSVLRTEETEPWAQAAGYQVFGAPDLTANGERRELRPELPRFGYRGELALREMIYLRARSYDTTLGRFTTRDPVTPQPGSLQLANPYAYAGNDPLNLTDPTGQQFGILSGLVHGAEGLGRDIVHGGSDIVHGAESAAHGTENVFLGFTQEAGHLGADLGTDLGGWLGRDLGNDIVHGEDYIGHEIAHFLDTGRHDAAVILKDIKVALATVAVLILQRLLSRYLGPSGVGLDNNVLVYGLTGGQLAVLDGKINRRHPVTSPQATLEFNRAHSPITLYNFLRQRRGRIGSQITEAEWKAVQTRSMSTLNQSGDPLVLTDPDSKVVASTMKDKIPIITNDKRMTNFLQAINYPVEPWKK